MTKEEAISVLENPDVSLGVTVRVGQEDDYWKKLSPALEMAISALRTQQEEEKNEPLTLEELREMDGEQVWCHELQCYGIVKVKNIGHWDNMPILVGSWHANTKTSAVNFEYDIETRGFKLYRRKPEEVQE